MLKQTSGSLEGQVQLSRKLKTKMVVKILENSTTTNLVLVGKTDLEKKNVWQ